MSQESVEIVRSVYERWNHDPEGIAEALVSGSVHEDLALELFDPGVEIRQVGALPDSDGTFHGHDGLIRSSAEVAEGFHGVRFAPEAWTERGEWIVVRLRVIGVGHGSGIKTEARLAQWRVQDGRVTHFHAYASEADALEAAGLRE